MKYLYVDNFRGFKDTFIAIKDVNYFVGENSTGKSSILSLIKLLTSVEFWFSSMEFHDKSQGINFGHFYDILSVHSPNVKQFSIGMFYETDSNDGKVKIFEGYLMTFSEDEGIPKLSIFSCNNGKYTVTVKYTKQGMQYSFGTCKEYKDYNNFKKYIFNEWVNNHLIKFYNYKIYKHKRGDSGYTIKTGFPVIIPELDEDTYNYIKSGKKLTQKHITFYIPDSPIGEDVVWLSPIRSKAKRTYDDISQEYSPEGLHTPYLIRKILNSKSQVKSFTKLLNKVGKESDLFEKIEIRRFGKSSADPFEVDIVLSSMSLNISNVGYGVSQSLPVIVEFINRSKDTIFIVQQPEVHLHPKAQAAIGGLIYVLSSAENKVFLIETHSDFMIDRFRLSYKKKIKNKYVPEAQILFFERTRTGNKVTEINIDKDGEISSNQPKKYREFFIKEELKNIGF